MRSLSKLLQLTKVAIFLPVVFLAVFTPIAQTFASDNQGPTTFTTTGPNDYYFELTAGTTFTSPTMSKQMGHTVFAQVFAVETLIVGLELPM